MPGKIKTTKINHVTTMVKDTARSMKFYNDLVGIKHVAGLGQKVSGPKFGLQLIARLIQPVAASAADRDPRAGAQHHPRRFQPDTIGRTGDQNGLGHGGHPQFEKAGNSSSARRFMVVSVSARLKRRFSATWFTPIASRAFR